MAQYRKKPVVIEAIQFDGSLSSLSEIMKMGGERKVIMEADHSFLKIETLEGVMKANRGDWVIQGVRGEIYPCKPDIFKETYEKV